MLRRSIGDLIRAAANKIDPPRPIITGKTVIDAQKVSEYLAEYKRRRDA